MAPYMVIWVQFVCLHFACRLITHNLQAPWTWNDMTQTILQCEARKGVRSAWITGGSARWASSFYWSTWQSIRRTFHPSTDCNRDWPCFGEPTFVAPTSTKAGRIRLFGFFPCVVCGSHCDACEKCFGASLPSLPTPSRPRGNGRLSLLRKTYSVLPRMYFLEIVVIFIHDVTAVERNRWVTPRKKQR